MIRTELLQKWTKERKVRQRLIELTKSYLNQSENLSHPFRSIEQWTPSQNWTHEKVIVDNDGLYITDYNKLVELMKDSSQPSQF